MKRAHFHNMKMSPRGLNSEISDEPNIGVISKLLSPWLLASTVSYQVVSTSVDQ